MSTAQEACLFDRLGGSAAITDIVGYLYDRMVVHPHIWYYWKGRSPEDRSAECRRFVEVVAAALKTRTGGGPEALQSHEAKVAHAGLGIGLVEWRIFVELAAESVDRFVLDDREKEELFSLLTTSKATLTGVKPASSPLAGFAGYLHGLTKREREVLRLVALGRKNPEIAAELFISVNTVTRHVTNIFVKTSTKNRVEAAVYAARMRLV